LKQRKQMLSTMIIETKKTNVEHNDH